MSFAAAPLLRTARRAAAGPAMVRRMGGPADPNAPPLVNCWEAPTEPSKWKGEHIVFAVLAGWAVVINVGRAAFSGGPKKEAAK